MTWRKWSLVTWFAMGALAVVLDIGKHHPPVTPGLAAVHLIVSALLISFVVSA